MISKIISDKVMDYLLDKGAIIGAEYDHADEYDAEHWVGILSNELEKIIGQGN